MKEMKLNEMYLTKEMNKKEKNKMKVSNLAQMCFKIKKQKVI